MNYPEFPQPVRRMNFHQSDFAEVLKWRRLALTGFVLALLFLVLFCVEVSGGH